MHKAKRRALVAAGFQIGDAEEFLGLTEEERRLVEQRISTSSGPATSTRKSSANAGDHGDQASLGRKRPDGESHKE